MPDPVNLGYAMRLEPKDAIAYFESKGYNISWNWGETAADAHARAFTVAKAARLDVLKDFRDGMQEVLRDGLTEREFLRAMEPRLKAKGWWGKQVIVDPDGGAEMVQLGSPHRLRTIYRTNKFSAYQAGRYKRQKERAESRPYWQYLAIMDSRTRPSHAALHEKVFRHDDPIWEQIYPPNGFNCRCRVRTLSESRLEAEGLAVDESSGHLQEEMAWAGVDKRTGEAYQQPVTVWRGTDARGRDAVFRTDPGFSGNQGQLGLWDPKGGLPDCETGRFFERPKGRCLHPVPNQPNWSTMGLPHLRDMPDSAWQSAPALLPAAHTHAEKLAITVKALGLQGQRQRTIQTPVGPRIIHRNHAVHIATRNDFRERYAGLVIPTLTDPLEVWAVDYDDHIRIQHVGLFRTPDKKPVLVVLRENIDGSFWLRTIMNMRLSRLNTKRFGMLLWSRKS